MRSFFIFLAFLPLFVDAQFNEGFDDGEISQNPSWLGTDLKFTVDSNNRLQLNAPPETSSAWLFTNSTAIEEATWEIDFTLDFNPSSSNYAKIWIAADNNDPLAIKNGMAVTIGATDDAIVLQSVANGKTTNLIKGAQGRLNKDKIDASLRIIRSANNWILEIKMDNEWINEGSIEIDPNMESAWFGMVCTYTQTRSTRFWFDNIKVMGIARQDRERPYVTAHQMKRPDRIDIEFNEPIISNEAQIIFPAAGTAAISLTQPEENIITLSFDPVTTDLTKAPLLLKNIKDLHNNILTDTTLLINYELFRLTAAHVSPPDAVILTFNGELAKDQSTSTIYLDAQENIPTSINVNGTELTALFQAPFLKDQPHTIHISGIQDTYGNTMTSIAKTIGLHEPGRNSVIITELMADPEPSMGLPNCEFIEIYNNTPFDMEIQDWQITVNQTSATLPAHTLPSYDFVILCPLSNLNQFVTTKKIAPSRWPAITNSGASIVLRTSKGMVADALNFDLVAWSDQTFKDEGGWSFEIIDVANRSASPSNWSYTGNLMGGTPGETNSNKAENPDMKAPEVEYIKMNPDNSMKICFTEPVNIERLTSSGEMTVNGVKQTVSVDQVDEVFNKFITISVSEEPERGRTYQIDEAPIDDLAGNRLTTDVMARYGVAEEPEAGDAVINEIMFNTSGDAPDYLEVLNTSTKILELKHLSIGELSEGQITTLTQITNKDRLFFPGDYIVATPDSLKTVASYNCANKKWVVKTNSFPSLTDDGKCLVLAKNNGELLESICYDKKMHHPLLAIQDGVSLERVDPKQPAGNSHNWQTASASSGYATPTAVNSQYKPGDLQQDNAITLTPAYFTPDGDGTDDYMMIRYNAESTGWTATIRIYDARGRLVKDLVNNEIMGIEGFWLWNGLDDNNQPLRTGNYIVLFKSFDTEGNRKEQKKSCTIGIAQKK